MPNPQSRIRDKIKMPYLQLQNEFSTKEKCLERIYLARAAKVKGCYKCGREVATHYKPVVDHKRWRPAYKCQYCNSQVYPLRDTVFQGTHVDLAIWFRVIIDKLINNSGITGNKIAYQYSLGDGTAFHLLHKIRTWMGISNEEVEFDGSPVAIDETGINTGTKGLGRKRKMNRGFGSDRITPCLTMIEPNGKVRSVIVPTREELNIIPHIKDHVDTGTIIYTDEYKGYSKLSKHGYVHGTVNHSKKQFRNGDACTNAAEGYFGLIKPTIVGTYRQITEPYSQNYLHETDFRYNNRHEPIDVRLQRLLESLPPLFSHIKA